jgi:hypothetical protein
LAGRIGPTGSGPIRRVFYRVVGDEVQVVMIGRKQRNVLIVDGKRFIL